MENSQVMSELFQLLWQMYKTVQLSLQQVESRCSKGQFFMLERLGIILDRHSTDGTVPVSTLAVQLRVLPAAVSRSLRQLEDAGLAERVPDPADHRRILVRLTPAGQALRRSVEDDMREYIHRVVQRMGEAEFIALLDSWRAWDEAMRAELPVQSGAPHAPCPHGQIPQPQKKEETASC